MPLSGAGHLCIPVVLSILNEVVGSYVPEENWQDAEETPVAVALGAVANIFQKVIETMALRLKKEPEEGKQVRVFGHPKMRVRESVSSSVRLLTVQFFPEGIKTPHDHTWNYEHNKIKRKKK